MFLRVFDSLVSFMLYTSLLESMLAPLVSTYAYVAIGATLLDETLWACAFLGGALVLGAVALELRGRREAEAVALEWPCFAVGPCLRCCRFVVFDGACGCTI